MPRDLESQKTKAILERMLPLAKDVDDPEVLVTSPPDPMPLYRMPASTLDERFEKMKDLHPYVMLLSQDDLDDCDWLEHAAFDAHEAATREKVPSCRCIPLHDFPYSLTSAFAFSNLLLVRRWALMA
jgi:hypothetical protein